MLVREHHTQGRATDAISTEQMKKAPREAPVYAEEVGYMTPTSMSTKMVISPHWTSLGQTWRGMWRKTLRTLLS